MKAFTPSFIGIALLIAGCCGDDDSETGAVGTLANQTARFLHVFAGGGTQLYVPPNTAVDLDLSDAFTVQIAFSPGQDAPAGIQHSVMITCCCVGAENCNKRTCGSLAVTGGDQLTVAYTRAECSSGGSCPYVYARGTEGLVPEGEVLSSAWFAAAARDDVLPLRKAAVIDGEVQARVATVLREIDVLTRATLLMVEHAADVETATGTDGALVATARRHAPESAVAAGGADVLPLVLRRDGRSWMGNFANAPVRDTLTLRFPGTSETRRRLVLALHNARAAEDALQAYLAELGPGFPGLMRGFSHLPGYRGKLDKVLRDSGLALTATLSQPGRPPQTHSISPVGSLAARDIAITFDDLVPGQPIEVVLAALPTVWEVDAAVLGAPADEAATVTEIPLARVMTSDGSSASITQATPYQQRQGQYLDLSFRVPSPSPSPTGGRVRSFALAVRGHYELVPGKGSAVDWGLLARRTLVGKDSFARYLRGERGDPRWSLCPKRMFGRKASPASPAGSASSKLAVACGAREGGLR